MEGTLQLILTGPKLYGQDNQKIAHVRKLHTGLIDARSAYYEALTSTSARLGEAFPSSTIFLIFDKTPESQFITPQNSKPALVFQGELK